jgi:hypothetical protein
VEPARFEPLLALSENYITEAWPTIPLQLLSELQQIMTHFMRGISTSQRASAIFVQKMGTSSPVNRIAAILRVPETSIVTRSDPISESFPSVSGRKKSHPWSEYEDQRLLCAISRFGLDDWMSVAQFVGNQRTRAQCAQRWFRGLDPRISRVMWTQEEEDRLAQLVQQYGLTAWTRISTELGHRSDAQCRYHYLQVMRGAGSHDSQGDESSVSDPKGSVTLINELKGISTPKSIEFELGPRRPRLPSIDLLIGVGL